MKIPKFNKPIFTEALWIGLTAAILFFVFLNIALKYLDPDLGWHLVIAQNFLETGFFPSVDVYSFAIKNFPWVVFEFHLSNLMYLIYKQISYLGLAVVFSGITAALLTLHIYLTRQIFKIRLLTILIFGGVLIIGTFSTFGIRTPVFSIWANIILFWLLWDLLKDKPRLLTRLSLMGLFLIWANCHPSFFVGVATLVIAVIYKTLRRKTVSLADITTVITTGLITLLNPYGIRLWWEALGHFLPTSSLMHTYIREWQSVFKMFPVDLLGLITLFFVLLVFIENFKKLWKNYPAHFIVAVIFLVGTFMATRNIGLLAIWALPLVLATLNNSVKVALPPKHYHLIRVLQGALAILIVSEFVSLLAINWCTNFLQTGASGYPSSKALDEVKQLTNQGEWLYNPYDWGGYLDWHFKGTPQVFIDGRMPATWFNKDNFPFKDYVAMYSTKGKGEIFAKYDFTVAIVKPTIASSLDPFNRFLIGGAAGEAKLNAEAERLSVKTWLEGQPNWKKVYKDDTAVIFVKK
ncbi:MAG: hypothetical protein NT141_02030 [candidate division WWE3 bacterium]|nr:hypothetical protein [candidate division WWE3 bacterium]